MGDLTYTHAWGACLDGYEEEGIRSAATRDEAIDLALEPWIDSVSAGWDEAGERLLTVYAMPVFCRGDDTGEYRCPCGDSHADGDRMLSFALRETLIARTTDMDGDVSAEVLGE